MARTARPRPPGPWEELRVFLAKDGQTLASLARLTGISLGHLTDLRNGRKSPSREHIAQIAAALDVPISMLTPDHMRLSGLPRPPHLADDSAGDRPDEPVAATA